MTEHRAVRVLEDERRATSGPRRCSHAPRTSRGCRRSGTRMRRARRGQVLAGELGDRVPSPVGPKNESCFSAVMPVSGWNQWRVVRRALLHRPLRMAEATPSARVASSCSPHSRVRLRAAGRWTSGAADAGRRSRTRSRRRRWRRAGSGRSARASLRWGSTGRHGHWTYACARAWLSRILLRDRSWVGRQRRRTRAASLCPHVRRSPPAVRPIRRSRAGTRTGGAGSSRDPTVGAGTHVRLDQVVGDSRPVRNAWFGLQRIERLVERRGHRRDVGQPSGGRS